MQKLTRSLIGPGETDWLLLAADLQGRLHGIWLPTPDGFMLSHIACITWAGTNQEGF